MGLNLRSLLLAAFVISNSITWTTSRHHFAHNIHGHRTRHRRQGAGLHLPTSFVIPGGAGSGSWGDWGEVSSCSRTCGWGVQHQKRICLEMAPDGRATCTGGDTKYFSCKTADCPAGAPDFRAAQCSEYDDVPFLGIKHKWIPYTNGPKKCELNCMPKGERFYYRHKDKVIDGTLCDTDPYNVCVDGTCQAVGCDMMLGSKAREDKCRRCRGDGSTCHTIRDRDTQDFIQGYNDVLRIPKGATNILIEEVRPSNNYLALHTPAESVNGTRYLLNGNYHIDFPRAMTIAGATWHYERRQQGLAAPDRLRCLGPTTEPLILSLLLVQEKNVGVDYEYSVPTPLAPPLGANYSWASSDFTPCNVSCGMGFQTRNVTCRSLTAPHEDVSDSLCDENLRPPSNTTCNKGECPAEWVPGPWSPCTEPCGEGGFRIREVHCEKVITNGVINFRSTVSDEECFRLLGPKPALREDCNKEAVCPTWFTGPWKPCDQLCDQGQQTRQVVCHVKRDGRVQVFPDEDCEAEKPPVQQPCMLRPCKGVEWVVSNWTACDCVTKEKSREMQCATKQREVVEANFCENHPRPNLTEACKPDDLSECEVQWYATQWSSCSVECGKGVKTRKVFCGLFNADSVVVVDDSRCKTEKYNDTTTCEIPPDKCPAKWFAGPWSKCSMNSSGCVRSREVMCLKGEQAASACDVDAMLHTNESCLIGECDDSSSKPAGHANAVPVIDEELEDVEYCAEEEEEGAEVGADVITTTDSGISNSTTWDIEDGSTSELVTDDTEETAESTTDFTGTIDTNSTLTTGSGWTDATDSADESTTEVIPESGATDVTVSTNTSTYSDLKEVTETDATSSTDSTLAGSNSTKVTESGATDVINSTDSTLAGSNSTKVTESGATDVINSTDSTLAGSNSTKVTESGATDVINSTDSTLAGSNSTKVTESGATDVINSTDSTLAGSNSTKVTESGATDVINSTDSTLAGSSSTEVTETGSTEATSSINSTLAGSSSTEVTETGTTEATSSINSTLAGSNSTKVTESGATDVINSTDSTLAGSSSTEVTETGTTEATSSINSTLAGSNSTKVTESGATDVINSTDSTLAGSSSTEVTETGTTEATSSINSTLAGSSSTEVTETGATDVINSTDSTLAGSSSTEVTETGSTEATSRINSTLAGSSSTEVTETGTTEATSSINSTLAGSNSTKVTESGATDVINSTDSTLAGSSSTEVTETGTTEATSSINSTLAGSNSTKVTESGATDVINSTDSTLAGSSSTEVTETGTTEATSSINSTLAGSNSTKVTESGATDVINSTDSTLAGSDSTEVTESTDTSGRTEATETTEIDTEATDSTTESGSTSTGSADTSETGDNTPWDWRSTLATTTKKQCVPRHTTCRSSFFGCCPDNKTPAKGPFDEGCPETLKTCKATEFGCCPDGVSPATRAQGQGCPPAHCELTLFGCCRSDNSTPAEGNDQEGCPPPPPACRAAPYGCCNDDQTEATGPSQTGCPETTTATELVEREGCAASEFGCCYDNVTKAAGPGDEGCPCNATEFGCCPDGDTRATSLDRKNCKEHGYCADGKTPAHGPNGLGCCMLHAYLCCPDNYKPAAGPNREGCECQSSQFGCCPDNVTIARGDNKEGCGCQHSKYGCCEDGHTAAGENKTNCNCHTYQFGCCPDGETVALGPRLQGCLCGESTYKCCGDGVTPASGPNGAGCDCATSKYGCCPDGQHAAAGIKFEGCPDKPINRQAVCSLPKDRGVRKPGVNYTVSWFYDMQDAGCVKFFYSGTGGNGNRFETKAACQDICVHPRKEDVCLLPKVVGSERCTEQKRRWYYDGEREQCTEFTWTGCLGNYNKFETRELCEAQCQPNRGREICVQTIEPGKCNGTFERWGYDVAKGRCVAFQWGGCGGSKNRFASKAACMLQCRPPGQLQKECTLPQEPGDCGEEIPKKIPAWSFSASEKRCLPFYYTGCGGNANRFPYEENCTEACPSIYDKHVCELPAVTGDCSTYELKWYYDLSEEGCRQFSYGGCGGNGNRFDSLRECQSSCAGVRATSSTPAPTVDEDLCQLPMKTGDCIESIPRWFYDAASDRCSQFAFSGCDGNNNNFGSAVECERRCRATPVSTTPATPPLSLECQVSDLHRCKGVGLVWYLDSVTRRCEAFNTSAANASGEGRCDARGVFPSPEACERKCGEFAGIENVCREPVNPGPCSKNQPKFYFDQESRACKSFTYGGCLGGPNRFSTIEECEDVCEPIKDPCQQPPVRGNCIENYDVWYHDPESNDCKPFRYTGCGGNENRFNTSAECASQCIRSVTTLTTTLSAETPAPPAKPVSEECRAPESLEPCGPPVPAFYFDAARSACVAAPIGACRHPGSWRSEEECERNCGKYADVKDPADLCRMSRDSGSCSARVAKYYWDKQALRCTPFTFGGCDGNANRFSSLEECEEVCAHLAQDPCQQPPVRGNCTENYDVWYHDPESNDCKPFRYTGCGGNENRFSTSAECASQCIRSVTTLTTTLSAETPAPPAKPVSEECRAPESLEPCGPPVPAFYFDAARSACVAAPIGACRHPGSWRSEEECERNCGKYADVKDPADLCRMSRDSGPCLDRPVTKFYWDKQALRCTPFTFGGCDGNANRFSSLDECEEVCAHLAQDPCQQPPVRGNCTENYDVWYHDPESNDCKPLRYTGCGGNENRFSTSAECASQCIRSVTTLTTTLSAETPAPPAKPVSEECRAPESLEPCGPPVPAFYFDAARSACVAAPIGACRHPGSWRSEEECERNCGKYADVKDPADLCRMSRDSGPCLDRPVTKFYWDKQALRCTPFTFGGCDGNANRFSSLDECEEVCAHLAQDPCQQPPVRGNCTENYDVWYHDPESNDCKPLRYTGCGGNENRFSTSAECASQCIRSVTTLTTTLSAETPAPPAKPVSEECRAPESLEPCGPPVPAFYFDAARSACVAAPIGACRHPGSWRSEEECERNCGKYADVKDPADLCRMSRDSGPCLDRPVTKFYWDKQALRCTPFTFGGCDGNANRFSSLDECEEVCAHLAQDPCQQPPVRGNCTENYDVWYHDPESNDCKPFRYTGCGGNENRFSTSAECASQCIRSVTTLTTTLSAETPAPPAKPVSEECRAPESLEPCGPPVPAFYFDAARSACVAAPIGACRHPGSWRSEEECERRCGKYADVKDPADLCRMSRDSGPCLDRPVTKFYWDKQTLRCTPFTFGGCDGNANRFSSLDECEEVCAHLAQDPCQQPPVRGNCTENYDVWYHDPESNDCKPLRYTGCGGNENRFSTSAECASQCIRSVTTLTTTLSAETPAPPAKPVSEECRAPESLEPCGPPVPAFYFDAARSACVAAPIGACRHPGSWRSEEECERNCGKYADVKDPADLCRMSRDSGPCLDRPVTKFYWDKQALRCTPFTFGGCDGNANRFSSLDECEEVCAHLAQDPCQQPPVRGTCTENYDVWYHDPESNDCKPFRYTGCGGNENRFSTSAECASQCIRSVTTLTTTLSAETPAPPAKPVSEECRAPESLEPCGPPVPAFYFDAARSACVAAPIGACRHPGSWRSEEECERNCGKYADVKDPADLCRMSRDSGSCSARVAKYYWDKQALRCTPFTFGGCDGNANRFSSLEECEEVCAHLAQDPCQQPPVRGNCTENYDVWYHDPESNDCKPFRYTGCGGNENRFSTSAECASQCIRSVTTLTTTLSAETPAPPAKPVSEECRAPESLEPCGPPVPAFYFDAARSACVAAPIGACRHPGSWRSEEECERRCGKYADVKDPADLCRMSRDSGPCLDRPVTKFYWDKQALRCTPFTFGGCDGNANRFSSLEECEEVCAHLAQDPCQQPPDQGNCFDNYKMWYHDPESNDCKPLRFTGCGGNQNRFNTSEHCEALCIRRPAPPAPAPPTPAPPTTTLRTEVVTPAAPPAQPVSEECRAPESLEPCGPPVPAFYFDAARSACVAAPIGACRHPGSWRSEEECERRCGQYKDLEDPADVCRMRLDSGSCRDRPVNKYYWDKQALRCRRFTYGGCDGNANRFSSLEECEEVCAHLAPDPACRLPEAEGAACAGAGARAGGERRWAYSALHGECRPLVYLGCGGNENNFLTFQECESLCSPSPDANRIIPVIPDCRAASEACATLHCENGVQRVRSADGCESCTCIVREPDCTKLEAECANITCPYGSKITRDADGCRRCACRPDPCEGQTCAEGERCAVTAERDPETQEGYYGSECRIKSKPGACPAEAPPTGSCRRECTDDAHCRGSAKCCVTGCSSLCLAPVAPDVDDLVVDIPDCRAATEACATLHCENGVQRVRSADGCDSCTCIVREPDCTKLEAECANITCPYGSKTTRDADGCRRCACRPDPCEGQTCAEGERCAVTAERDPETQEGYYGSECRIKSKPGACPAEAPPTGSCRRECTDDAHCRGSAKCCVTGCSSLCRAPVAPDVDDRVVDIPDCRAATEACATLHCENGVQRVRSADGCESCTCIVREPDCTKLEAECANITCPYGSKITRDADGCRRCGCLRHPCEGRTCAEGERCVAIVERDPVTQDLRYPTECRIKSKPGACPAEAPLTGSCRRECADDADCRGSAKCCVAGCSSLCRAPVAPDVDDRVVDRPHAPQPDPHTEREVAAQEGGLARLRCLFHSNPPPRITWRRGEITIDGDNDRYRITSDGALEIVSLYRNDAGVYICIAENHLGRTQQEVILRVNNPSQQAAGISGAPKALISGEVGRPLSIRCLVYGYPTPSIAWSRGPTGPMVAYYSEMYEARGNVLLIRALDVATLGQYTCQAYNGIGKPAQWTVTVRAPRRDPAWPPSPYLLPAPELRSARGPVVELPAPVATTTPPTPPTPPTQATQATQSPQSVDSNLIENPYVPFTDPVRTVLRPTTTTLAAGAELSLPCEVDGYPEPVVAWTKDGVYLQPSERLEMTAARLTLRDLTVADSGEYGCHARNDFTSHSSSVAITVQEMNIPEHCTDNQFFANCQLIVRSKFCNHKYYSTFCCKSCVEAGLLNPQNLQLQTDQSWMKK